MTHTPTQIIAGAALGFYLGVLLGFPPIIAIGGVAFATFARAMIAMFTAPNPENWL